MGKLFDIDWNPSNYSFESMVYGFQFSTDYYTTRSSDGFEYDFLDYYDDY